MRTFLLLLAMLVATSAQASLISVTANSGWSCGTGTGGFEPGCSPNVEFGMMNFVYDTSVLDSDPDPLSGVYLGALVAFTMTVEQQTRPDLFFTLAPGPNELRVPSFAEKWVRLRFVATEQSGAYGDSSDMLFSLGFYHAGIFADDSLPGASYWEGATALVGDVAGVNETDFAWNIRAVEIPVPGTLALICIGLPLLARRRKAAGIRDTH